MNVQAEMSLYPLRRASLVESIGSFVDHIRHCGFEVTVGPMSSCVTGECSSVFRTLGDAFEKAAHRGDVVLTLTLSNACPRTGEKERSA